MKFGMRAVALAAAALVAASFAAAPAQAAKDTKSVVGSVPLCYKSHEHVTGGLWDCLEQVGLFRYSFNASYAKNGSMGWSVSAFGLPESTDYALVNWLGWNSGANNFKILAAGTTAMDGSLLMAGSYKLPLGFDADQANKCTYGPKVWLVPSDYVTLSEGWMSGDIGTLATWPEDEILFENLGIKYSGLTCPSA